MEEIELVKYCMQFGFSALVCAFLLWERTKFNQKMLETMKEISTTLQLMYR